MGLLGSTATFVLLALLSVPVAAAPKPTAMDRVIAIRKTLPVPANWHFFLVTEADWRKVQLGTHSAYSNLAYNTTFIRESYAISAQDDKLRHTIAHEMGHRICNCTDEGTADRIADQLIRDSQPAVLP
jgi:hypothetical protein